MALRYYATLGIRFTAVMTDNGACYKSRAFARLLRRLGLRRIRTRSYAPRTNGKAERFIQTALREWARVCVRPLRPARTGLARVAHQYNWHRLTPA